MSHFFKKIAVAAALVISAQVGFSFDYQNAAKEILDAAETGNQHVMMEKIQELTTALSELNYQDPATVLEYRQCVKALLDETHARYGFLLTLSDLAHIIRQNATFFTQSPEEAEQLLQVLDVFEFGEPVAEEAVVAN